MKTTNKLSLLLAATCLIMVATASSSFAQGRFSIGANLGLPMGSFSDGWGIGIGGTAAYESNISDKLNWTATAGFLSFGGKDFSGVTIPAVTMIPILGGVKYYVNEMFNGFYVSGQIGITAASIGLDAGNGTTSTYSETDFTIAPGAGYHLANIDIGASYQVISNLNYVGLRVAYVFGGK